MKEPAGRPVGKPGDLGQINSGNTVTVTLIVVPQDAGTITNAVLDSGNAIVTTNGGDYGFEAARTVSKIPVAGLVHSAVHAASLIGDRFTIAVSSDKLAHSYRGLVEGYGLGNKLAGSRSFNVQTPDIWEA